MSAKETQAEEGGDTQAWRQELGISTQGAMLTQAVEGGADKVFAKGAGPQLVRLEDDPVYHSRVSLVERWR